MANASAKRQAIVNKNHLSVLHRVSAVIYFSTFVYFKVAKKHFWLQLLFSIPGMVAELLLDQWCRPRYGPKKTLLSSGMDIEQPGLIDYVKDVMFLNWGILLLSVGLGLRAWFTAFLVPVFVAYKAFQLLKAGKRMMGGQSQSADQKRAY